MNSRETTDQSIILHRLSLTPKDMTIAGITHEPPGRCLRIIIEIIIIVVIPMIAMTDETAGKLLQYKKDIMGPSELYRPSAERVPGILTKNITLLDLMIDFIVKSICFVLTPGDTDYLLG
jgi:hypothetical protein